MAIKQSYRDNAIKWASLKAADDLRIVDHEEYEDPKSFRNRTTDEIVQPFITFVTRRGEKHYSEIILKSETDSDVISKYKFLSFLAVHKEGKLHLLAPKGHLMFAKKLTEENKIEAEIHSI